MNRKEINKLKEQILEALDEDKPISEILKGLVGIFYALAISDVGIKIMAESLKK